MFRGSVSVHVIGVIDPPGEERIFLAHSLPAIVRAVVIRVTVTVISQHTFSC